MHQVKNAIFYEDVYLGVTIGALVYPHGTIFIDAPLRPEDARAWKASLASQRSGANRLLVSLDAHVDRTLGTKALDCTILAHQRTALVFRDRPNVFKGQSSENGSEWESYGDSIGTRWAIPDITYQEQVVLHWGGPPVIVEHHPGPTPGSSWVVIPDEEVVFVGDAVYVNQPPFLANADLQAWLQTLDTLYNTCRHFNVISGRGGIITRDAVKDQHALLKDLLKRMDKLGKKNAPPEATEKLVPLVLEQVSIPQDKKDYYIKRLQNGLYQYYLRNYRRAGPLLPDLDLEDLG